MVMASATLPPAQPAFVLRGHSAQIHALHFTQGNARLLTADAEGWVISWNLSYKRPAAVWKAHENAILGLGSWGPDRLITHARDNKLLVWQLKAEDEVDLVKSTPVDGATESHKKPWLVHAMPVNALNFCSFAMCYDGMAQTASSLKAVEDPKVTTPILFAVPNAIDSGGIDLFQLPSRRRAATINGDRALTTGMVMALSILAKSTRIQVAAGYESGHTMVFVQTDPGAPFEKLYCAQSHTQPILSIAVSPCNDHYITSSADATIAKHPFPSNKSIFKTEFKPIKTVATKHAGQQGLSYRSDGRIFSTAGWDNATRVYSSKTVKEVAVLKWHKEGCYVTAFAAIDPPSETADSKPDVEEPGNKVATEVATTKLTMSSIQRRRDQAARSTHWLAVGSKDGKVSLWDIF